MAPLNPKCTEFCTQGGSRGHRATPPGDVDFMLHLLGDEDIRPEDATAAVHLLYRKGYGYHAIADTLGITHQEGFMLLTGQGPEFKWNGRPAG